MWLVTYQKENSHTLWALWWSSYSKIRVLQIDVDKLGGIHIKELKPLLDFKNWFMGKIKTAR